MKNWGRLYPVGALLALSGVAEAVEWQVYGGLEEKYEDNPAKLEDGSSSDLLSRFELGARLNNQTRTTLIDFDYRYQHDNWLDDTFANRNTFEGFLQFNWAPTNYFSLFLNNRRLDQIRDSTQTDTQNNRDVRGTTQLGMIFTGSITPVDSLNLSPTFTTVNYQGGNGVDSKRYGLLGYWGHRFSPNDQFTLNLFGERIDFDQEDTSFLADLDRAQTFLGYSAQLARLSYGLEFGYTWVRRDDSQVPDGVPDSANDFSAPMYRANVRYVYENHSLSLQAYRDLTDTSIGSSAYNTGSGIGFGGDSGNVNDLALINLTNILLRYNLGFGNQRWNWGIGYRFYKQDVEATASLFSSERDEVANRIYTDLGYQVTQRIRLQGNFAWWNQEYPEFDQFQNRIDWGVNASFELFRYGFLDLGFRQENRDTDVVNQSIGFDPDGFPIIVDIPQQNYTNNSVFLRFRAQFPDYYKSRQQGFGPRREVGY